MRERPQVRIEPLVETIATRLAACADRPFAFFGHSMGALVAFETARELRRRGGATPAHLTLSARPAAQLPRSYEPVHELADDEFLEALRRLFAPPELAWSEPELMALMLPVLKADMAICDTYEYLPEPPLASDLLVVGGESDPSTSVESLGAWREQTSGRFALEMFPGGHFYLAAEAPKLLALIQRRLESVAS